MQPRFHSGDLALVRAAPHLPRRRHRRLPQPLARHGRPAPHRRPRRQALRLQGRCEQLHRPRAPDAGQARRQALDPRARHRPAADLARLPAHGRRPHGPRRPAAARRRRRCDPPPAAEAELPRRPQPDPAPPARLPRPPRRRRRPPLRPLLPLRLPLPPGAGPSPQPPWSRGRSWPRGSPCSSSAPSACSHSSHRGSSSRLEVTSLQPEGQLPVHGEGARRRRLPLGRAFTGDTVFLRLVDRVGVRFDYRLHSQARLRPGGTASLAAVLESSNGWKRVFELQRPTRFAGKHAVVLRHARPGPDPGAHRARRDGHRGLRVRATRSRSSRT